jgi:hypothetical protein
LRIDRRRQEACRQGARRQYRRLIGENEWSKRERRSLRRSTILRDADDAAAANDRRLTICTDELDSAYVSDSVSISVVSDVIVVVTVDVATRVGSCS